MENVDLFLGNWFPQTNFSRQTAGNDDQSIAAGQANMQNLGCLAIDGLLGDFLDDPDALSRIDYFVTDFK